MDQPPWDEDHVDDWAVWVVDHGVPDPPDELVDGMAVPVARWVDDDLAAVLFLTRAGTGDGTGVDYDMVGLHRVAGGWLPSAGSGGGEWFDPPFARPPLGPTEVWPGDITTADETDWSWCATCGVVGDAVTHIEVHRDGRAVARPVESPFGAYVVVTAADEPAELVAVLADGTVAGRTHFGGGYGEPDPADSPSNDRHNPA